MGEKITEGRRILTNTRNRWLSSDQEGTIYKPNPRGIRARDQMRVGATDPREMSMRGDMNATSKIV